MPAEGTSQRAVDSIGSGSLRLEEVPCNLCGSGSSVLVHRKDGFRIVRCEECGLIYVNPRLCSEALVSQYEEGYFFAGSYADYLSERKGLERTFERRLEKIEELAAPGRVLDVGCAFGFFLSVAQNRGWDAYGVDVSRFACRYAREQVGVQVFDGTLREVGFDDAFFDVVVMNDVFEHLPDPSAELAEVQRVLRTGGFLFIVTQDVSSAIVRLLGRRWAQYKPREHLYYFSRVTLRLILEKSGFEIVQMRSDGLTCTAKFMLGKLRKANTTLGTLGDGFARRLGLQDLLIPVWTGYEVMVCACKKELQDQ